MSFVSDNIKKESEEALKNGSAEEMADLIYDTLFQNIEFPQLEMGKLTVIDDELEYCQEVDRWKKEITFGYLGYVYKVKVELV